MINFIVVTHGEFGAYLVEAAESIVGRQSKGVRVITISQRHSVPEIRERIQKSIEELAGPDGLIVFTDMPGGTPGNLSFPLLKDKDKVEMISGVNMYMLVNAFSHRSDTALAPLVQKLVADGQKSIRDVRQMFLTRSHH